MLVYSSLVRGMDQHLRHVHSLDTGTMQVPPLRLAFQMLLGDIDGTNQLARHANAELPELSDAPAATSFISLVLPLLEPDSPVAMNTDPIDPAITAKEAAHDTSSDLNTDETMSNELDTRLSRLSAELNVYPPSTMPPSNSTTGEWDATHDAPRLAKTSEQPSDPPSASAYRAVGIADTLTSASLLSSTATPVETPSSHPRVPEPDPLPNSPSPGGVKERTAADTDIDISRHPQPAEPLVASAANEEGETLLPAPVELSKGRSINAHSTTELPQTTGRAGSTSLVGEQSIERSEVDVVGVSRPGIIASNNTAETASAVGGDDSSSPVVLAPRDASSQASGEEPSEKNRDNQEPRDDLTQEAKTSTREHRTVAAAPHSSTTHAEPPTAKTTGVVPDAGDLRLTASDVPPFRTIPSPISRSNSAIRGNMAADPLVPQSVEIAAQVVEAVSLEASIDRQRAPRLELQLDPPELGKVWIELTDASDGLVAKITVDRADTHQLLESEIAQIRSSLDEAGVHVSDFQVGHDESRFQDGSPADKAQPWMNQDTEEADTDELEIDSRRVQRFGPQGSRIDVRL